jgi:hypothetical protein
VSDDLTKNLERLISSKKRMLLFFNDDIAKYLKQLLDIKWSETMADLLDKLSSYNLFNYLLPGIIFAVLVSNFTRYSLIQKDIIVGLFLYYFIGLAISRFGSLIIEPFLLRMSFIQFAPYKDYLEASEKDKDLKLCSEINNTYRTFCSLFSLLLLMKFYDWIQSIYPVLKQWDEIVLVILMLVFFLFSYRKQTSYVRKRVEKAKARR